MRILFFITTNGNGRGGHYHSLNHISREIGKDNEVKIISIGSGENGVLNSNPYFVKHIFFNGLNFIKLKNEIDLLKKKFKPDIYHCFDSSSYSIIRLIISSKNNKIILNKCGGPNSKHYPHANNIILFSSENYEWFKKNRKYKKVSIYLIPNRVRKLKLDNSYFPFEKNKLDFIFVRICRIGHVYKKSIDNSISLIKHLIVNGVENVKLYIIGTIIDADIYEEIVKDESVINGNVILITDDKYTLEASNMLYLADAVIGTGRGLMEASSLSLPILAIDKNGNIPILIDDQNFTDAFKTNFSERNIFKNNDVSDNLEKIKKLIKHKDYYKKLSQFSTNIFTEHFDVSKVSSAYENVYIKSKKGDRYIVEDSYIIIYDVLKFLRLSILNY